MIVRVVIIFIIIIITTQWMIVRVHLIVSVYLSIVDKRKERNELVD